MALSQEDLAAVAALIAAANGGTSSTEAAKPAASKAKATAHKAGTIVRNFDAIEVDTTDDEITFKVVPTTASGSPMTRGARVVAYVGGQAMRSLNDAVLAELENADLVGELRKAVSTVNVRARLGDFAITADEREAAKAAA